MIESADTALSSSAIAKPNPRVRSISAMMPASRTINWLRKPRSIGESSASSAWLPAIVYCPPGHLRARATTWL